MTLDTVWLVTFFSVFVRMSAMLLSSPLLGTMVPVPIRVFIGAAMAMALTPVVGVHPTGVPSDVFGLVMMLGTDVLIGLVIGGLMSMLTGAFQTAGALCDTQLGLASAQLFNPTLGMSVTPLATFKFLLASVLLFVTDAHHLMIEAFVSSYHATEVLTSGSPRLIEGVLNFVGQSALISLQIAAPVAAVTVIIDVSASLINRAVPQTQPFLIALPAKIAFGILVLGASLPTLAALLRAGIEIAMNNIHQIIGA
ncbi:MAG: flagellar biosynthetic protein FliR [Fimbriimonadaceae bacterium]|nr:flagellar biosynthetic protein FliR [Fimbriimonadaceae bacterium]